MTMTDKIKKVIEKEQMSLKISSSVLVDFRLEVQLKFGKTHTHLGETVEEALVDWIKKAKLIRKNKKKEMLENNEPE